MNQSENVFSAHNILLDDGRQTRPENGCLLVEEPGCVAAIKTLRALFPGGLTGVRIADLGCLEGGYAVEFARLGMEAVGLEVRDSNFQNCEFVKRNVALPNLQFVQDDAWNIARYGVFDVIYCCGLLYHIDRPREFLTLLAGQCRRALILNTHFAPETDGTAHPLLDLSENEGLPGRWAIEFEDGFTGDRDPIKWASWTNDKSFWPTRIGLLQAIYEAGFPLVMEQYDWMAPDIVAAMTDGAYHTNSRGIFIGIKS